MPGPCRRGRRSSCDGDLRPRGLRLRLGLRRRGGLRPRLRPGLRLRRRGEPRLRLRPGLLLRRRTGLRLRLRPGLLLRRRTGLLRMFTFDAHAISCVSNRTNTNSIPTDRQTAPLARRLAATCKRATSAQRTFPPPASASAPASMYTPCTFMTVRSLCTCAICIELVFHHLDKQRGRRTERGASDMCPTWRSSTQTRAFCCQ